MTTADIFTGKVWCLSIKNVSLSPQIQKIMTFEKEIKEYEDLRRKYQTLIINKMDREEYIKYNEVLFSTFSCAIEEIGRAHV